MPSAPANPMTDTALLQRYADTLDPHAFSSLVDRFLPLVLAVCRRRLGDEDLVDRAAVAAFFRIAEDAGRVRSNAAAWVHACAARAAEELATQPEEPALAAGDNRTETGWREIEPIIDRALLRLEDPLRDALINRFLLGRSEAETAEQAGIDEAGSLRRTANATEILRGHLTRAGASIDSDGSLGRILASMPDQPPPSPRLAAALAKIGIERIGSPAPARRSGRGIRTIAVAVIAAVALGVLIGGAAVLLSGMQPEPAQDPGVPAESAGTP